MHGGQTVVIRVLFCGTSALGQGPEQARVPAIGSPPGLVLRWSAHPIERAAVGADRRSAHARIRQVARPGRPVVRTGP
jgi:hypothetical protein